jgi:hypothetical protein
MQVYAIIEGTTYYLKRVLNYGVVEVSALGADSEPIYMSFQLFVQNVIATY